MCAKRRGLRCHKLLSISAWRAHNAIRLAGFVKPIRCLPSRMTVTLRAARDIRAVTHRSSGPCGKGRAHRLRSFGLRHLRKEHPRHRALAEQYSVADRTHSQVSTAETARLPVVVQRRKKTALTIGARSESLSPRITPSSGAAQRAHSVRNAPDASSRVSLH